MQYPRDHRERDRRQIGRDTYVDKRGPRAARDLLQIRASVARWEKISGLQDTCIFLPSVPVHLASLVRVMICHSSTGYSRAKVAQGPNRIIYPCTLRCLDLLPFICVPIPRKKLDPRITGFLLFHGWWYTSYARRYTWFLHEALRNARKLSAAREKRTALGWQI